MARLGPVRCGRASHRARRRRATAAGAHRRRGGARADRALRLAPLHQAKSLAALAAVGGVLGDVPAVACFDTAFHATLPAAAHTYALPQAWRERWGLRRYGFHGLAHASAARRRRRAARPAARGTAARHLSPRRRRVAGRRAGRPLGRHDDGLHAARRPGHGDAIGQRRPRVAAVAAGAHRPGRARDGATRSSTIGAAGARRRRRHARRPARGRAGRPPSDPGPRRLHHHLRAGIAAMAAAMDGLDALVFCGGVGEHAAAVRAGAATGSGSSASASTLPQTPMAAVTAT